jgi:ectoine hydroxylase-related dioxygenase (phytanoyl-CoA dioxygenase family)
MTSPDNHLTEAERAHYEAEGFFIREDVFSEGEIEDFRDAAERIHQQVLDAAEREDAAPIDQVDNQKFQEVLGSTIKWEWRDDLRAVRSMEPTYHLDKRFEQLIDDPRLWQPSADVIGTQHLSLFSDKLNVKRPGGAPFPWHQEGPYWAYGAEDLEHVITLMIYFDDGTRDNGCLWLIPGTHQYGALEGLKGRGTLGALYTDVDKLDEEPFPIEMRSGSVVWFHRDIVHGSQTNRSEVDRRGFLLAYQPGGLHQWRNGVQRDIDAGGGY